MQPEGKTDEEPEHDRDRERDCKGFQRIGKVKPEQIRLHQPAEKLDRLPGRAQGDIADHEISELPKQEQADNQDDRIPECGGFLLLHQPCPRLASNILSQRDSRLLAAIDSSRMSRMSGYIVALSKFV